MKKSRKRALLLHNPTAGDENHEQVELTKLVTAAGYTCEYRPLNGKDWKKGLDKADLLVVAGGDGTVRNVVRALLKKCEGEFPPIGLLPMGTANNISKTVNESQDADRIAANWKLGRLKPFDIGRLRGLDKKHFFIEGLGFGVFPTLVSVMQLIGEALTDDPEHQLDTALILLAGIIRSYKTKHCSIEIDGVDCSGSYLLVEAMNICSIGPNLWLSPNSAPGDGKLQVALIEESSRQKLVDYISARIRGIEPEVSFPTVTGRSIRFRTNEESIHIDDELVRVEGHSTVDITMEKGRLRFLA